MNFKYIPFVVREEGVSPVLDNRFHDSLAGKLVTEQPEKVKISIRATCRTLTRELHVF